MKRIIACMIALALFVMAFAGCSATTDGENDAPVESTQPDVEPSTEPSTEPVVEEDAINPLENAKEYIYQIYKNVASKTPAGSTWTVSGLGRSAWTMAAAAIAMGGNVRVGFEDNIYLGKGQKAASNGELVAKVVRIAKELGREIATPAEAREILSLKPLK